uniref:VWFA domain-containing protein n=1 Tax=Chromera velia CCMP2878 TaxID=1169474 RepID=A0A0G4F746_9ALVE|eukprot:Cvel_15564.t1-p1 / transcript=Cvel_15564.t1 / gene=Cvel_15564 / organism=Chromera_velia_CCMP2878 / gene_product=von Willebrand factor A domain-containing protein, putative / transcript_product=von Willebrand factor A domain-containing protein, putative / location=Cvel_scaffold1157:19893-24821(+) / protein_length=990 / sequence_SO=supercontig / SO=protein_coding / is_pseudo=false
MSPQFASATLLVAALALAGPSTIIAQQTGVGSPGDNPFTMPGLYYLPRGPCWSPWWPRPPCPTTTPSPDTDTGSQNFSFPVPLKSSHASVKMVDLVAEVTFTQTFQNYEEEDLEAKYVFPLVENAAVSGFKAYLNGTVVEGRVEGREQAKRTYQVAVDGGDSAFLLEQQMPDVFEISVGRLLPGEEVKIEISYVFDVKFADGCARLILPTAVAPRYAPEDFDLPDFVEDIVYNTGNNGTGNFSTNNATYSADVAIEMKGGQSIASVSSPSHPHLSSTVAQDALEASFAFPPQNLSHNATDFVVVVDLDGAKPPQIVWEVASDRQSVAAMLTLVPAFTNAEIKPEIIFVTDVSGSMSGGKIATARSALKLFLQSLPTDSYFNIIAFETSYRAFSSGSSRKYTAETRDEADTWIDTNIVARGGTNILRPLEYVENLPPVQGYARQVILLTDGQVWNTDEVVNLVRRTTETTRYFTIGVGSGASRDLIARVASVGRGHEENVVDGEDPRMAVMSQLERASHASVNDLSLKWPQAENLWKAASIDTATSSNDTIAAAGVQRLLQAVGGAPRLSFWSPTAAAAAPASRAQALRGSAPAPSPTSIPSSPPSEATEVQSERTSNSTTPAVQPSVPAFISAPYPPPAVYSNKHLTLYALWTVPPSSLNEAVSVGSPLSVSLNGSLAGTPIDLSMKMNNTGREADGVGIVHHMAARAVLRDLREKNIQNLLSEEEKKGAEALGVRFGLASEWTSWVATLEREGGGEEASSLITRRVPQPGGYGYVPPAAGYPTSSIGSGWSSTRLSRPGYYRSAPVWGSRGPVFGVGNAFGGPSFGGVGAVGASPFVGGAMPAVGGPMPTPALRAPTTTTPATGLLGLVQLQQFDGYFASSDAERIRTATAGAVDVQAAQLMTTVRDSLNRLVGASTSPRTFSFSMPNFSATLGAVAWLEADPVRASASRLVLQKARSWLRSRVAEAGGAGSAASVDSLVNAARGSLGI